VLDYASYPLGMLVVAPVVLRNAGAGEYGLWMVATAVVSAGGIIASGFSDVGTQRVARLRGENKPMAMIEAVRTTLAINLALGLVIALVASVAAPYAARHIAASRLTSERECLICLRIASVMILMRAIEAVSVAAQRAFEEYRGTVQISTTIRLLTLGSAGILALLGRRTESIMIATAVLFAVGTWLQFRHLGKFLDTTLLWPMFEVEETRNLLGKGIFVWFQALGSVLFRQLDRILLGISLGAGAVAPYSVSIQFAEPLFGLTASGLSFFFPYLSGRVTTLSSAALRRTVLKVFLCNLLLVAGAGGILLLFGKPFLRIWAGPAVAYSAAKILPLIVVGSALSGLSVTGIYTMQALGMFRIIAYISLASRGGLLLMMFSLLHHRGLQGLAIARVCSGVAALFVYLPLIRQLGFFRKSNNSIPSGPIATEPQGGAWR